MSAQGWADLIESRRATLRGLAYRILGDAAEAEDIVQESWLRVTEAQADPTLPPMALLRRITTRLAIDRLRRRRRLQGPRWLPSPVQTAGDDTDLPPFDPEAEEWGPEARYERRESVTMALLVALESLSPTQRAVLVLRDVCGYASQEVATLLELREPTVRQHLVRARARVRAAAPPPGPFAARSAAVAASLQRFVIALSAGDSDALRAALCADVALKTDESPYPSANRPVLGREPVARIYEALSQLTREELVFRWTEVNGLPALYGERVVPREGWSPRVVVLVEAKEDGIGWIWSFQGDARFRGAGRAEESGV